MKKPTPVEVQTPMPEVYPTSGGSWIMDPKTGVLTRNPEDPALRVETPPDPIPDPIPEPSEAQK